MFDPNTVASATNLRFNGVAYRDLPGTALTPSGTYQSQPFWLMGADGARIFGLKDLPTGGYGGFTGGGIPWSAGPNVAPYKANGPAMTAPVDYAAPNVPDLANINPMDAQLLFSGTGSLGQVGVGPITLDAPEQTDAPRIETGGGGGLKPWMWVAIIVGGILLLDRK